MEILVRDLLCLSQEPFTEDCRSVEADIIKSQLFPSHESDQDMDNNFLGKMRSLYTAFHFTPFASWNSLGEQN